MGKKRIVKQIDSKFIPDECIGDLIVKNQTIKAKTKIQHDSTNSYVATIPYIHPLTVGTHYNIVIDGEDHYSICTTIDDVPVIGNPHMVNEELEDNGESFVVVDYSFMGDPIIVIATTDVDTYDLSIYAVKPQKTLFDMTDFIEDNIEYDLSDEQFATIAKGFAQRNLAFVAKSQVDDGVIAGHLDCVMYQEAPDGYQATCIGPGVIKICVIINKKLQFSTIPFMIQTTTPEE